MNERDWAEQNDIDFATKIFLINIFLAQKVEINYFINYYCVESGQTKEFARFSF